MGKTKGDGRGRARLGDETWRSGRGGEAGDDRKRPIFDLTERSRPWLETFPQRAFRRPHPRSLLKSSGGLHRFAIGHGLGRRKERGREPRVSRGRGWRYTKKRWAEWHGKLFLKSRDPSLPRHLSSRSSSRDARSGINNLTPCRTDKPAPLLAVQQRGRGTSTWAEAEGEGERRRLRKLRGTRGIAYVSYRMRGEGSQRSRVDIADQPEFLTSVRSHIVSDASSSRSTLASSSSSSSLFLFLFLFSLALSPFPFPSSSSITSGKKRQEAALHETRRADKSTDYAGRAPTHRE